MSHKSAAAAETKTIARNKRATFDYAIDERYEAGIVLLGSEVKSIRDGRVSLGESYARFSDDGELFLLGAHVAEYPWANRNQHDPVRPRKLLLNKRELAQLSDAVRRSGYTLVPLSVYLKRNHIKLELGLGKGKKLFDKRETLKKKTAQRDIERELK